MVFSSIRVCTINLLLIERKIKCILVKKILKTQCSLDSRRGAHFFKTDGGIKTYFKAYCLIEANTPCPNARDP